MHDYHAVEALIERLSSELGDLEVGRITQVRVRAGVVFSPAALRQAYEMLTPGTMLEGSVLVVEERPDERECQACGKSRVVTSEDLAGHLLVCPSCGVPSMIESRTGIQVLDIAGGRMGERLQAGLSAPVP